MLLKRSSWFCWERFQFSLISGILDSMDMTREKEEGRTVPERESEKADPKSAIQLALVEGEGSLCSCYGFSLRDQLFLTSPFRTDRNSVTWSLWRLTKLNNPGPCSSPLLSAPLFPCFIPSLPFLLSSLFPSSYRE